MLFIALFNWDMIIANYNIHHNYSNTIDTRFLLSLSDKTLQILDENKEQIIYRSGNEDFERQLSLKIDLFMLKIKHILIFK